MDLLLLLVVVIVFLLGLISVPKLFFLILVCAIGVAAVAGVKTTF